MQVTKPGRMDNGPLPLHPLSRPQGQERVLEMLLRLCQLPPKVVLLEGGSREDRAAVARFWAAALVCEAEIPPCTTCLQCQRVGSDFCRDVLVFGQEEPLSIEQVRELRSILGHPPSGPFRVVIFEEAHRMNPAAANALLKALEEPLPGNHFVLLAPVKQSLLPTLVSRSQIFTLNWRRKELSDEDVETWKQRLLTFFQTGQGLFEYTGKKGGLDVRLVQEIIVSCQQDLLFALSGEKETALGRVLNAQFSPEQLFKIKAIFDQTLLTCQYNVNLGLVLDWMAVEIYSLSGVGGIQPDTG